MEVLCNGRQCVIEFHGSVVTCTPKDDENKEAEPDVFTITEITQLLRSRRDSCAAKVIVGSRTFVMRFVNAREREQFVKNVRLVDGTEGSNVQWVTSAICDAAVDTGVLSEEDLDLIMKEECPRGVVTAFDAIGSLVDPVTFKLRPITEQLTNDIFRQIPVLAKIFGRHVTDEETMVRFWEAVVRKYFCFSRTFLEEEIRALDDEGCSGATEPGSNSEEDALQNINVASERALPKFSSHLRHNTVPVGEAPCEQRQPPHAHFFRGRPSSASSSRRWQCTVQPCQAYAGVQCPPSVSRELPKSTSRDVLEVLKKFWGGDTKHRKALRSKLEGLKKVASNNVLQRSCLDRTTKFLDEIDAEHGGATPAK
ncbi:hypothetical protein, conserved [Trypanosoma brucei gambiense DAL972]|uniref:TFIIH basal transcription factor subunit n=1 Tax=Trypanosoma brucei gambiense (strain MHOM/CI/86/DAL972) TaxID=679716 RepID=D0A8D9_TRYB9|nr:hypothetical protein, conserved [Trypanosoma brucei gambiense DAL972]CBH17940.1 hypothetical protein, conserved [Trypanosoma brucei gambiense DAL972]|eukprot:XP_011780204.1 hypothetical protein, conserved [Trypanosoma brucei gambiense DAL972]